MIDTIRMRYRSWRTQYLGWEIDKALGHIGFCTGVIAKGKGGKRIVRERERAEARLKRLCKRLDAIVTSAK